MDHDLQPGAADALRLLADGAAAVAHAPDLASGLAQLLDLAIAATRAARGAILVQDPSEAELDVAAARGYDPSGLDAIVGAAGGETAFTEAAARPAGILDLPLEGTNGALVSLLPLIAGAGGIDAVVGMLVVERRGDATDDRAATILHAIADLAAATADRVQVRSLVQERADWFERVASTDLTTGLANRLVLGRVLEHELMRAGRQATEVSLAVFDVDGFRALNDSAGREAGDRVLQEVAVAIAGNVRMVDTVARLGGDEFAVVAPGAGGAIVARRIMAAIGRLAPAPGRAVSVSAGVARYPHHGATADELLAAAVDATREAQSATPGALVEASATRSA